MTSSDNNDVFYVLFPVENTNGVHTITVRIKDGVAELSSGASSHRAFVISKLKEYNRTFYECSSREDFDFKYLAYRLTGDMEIFKC